MGNLGPIGDSASLHAWILSLAGTEEGRSLQQALFGDEISSFYTDKEFIEEISKMVPAPILPPLLLNQILQDSDASFGISRLMAGGATAAQILGLAESAIVLSCLVNWLQSQEKEKEAIRDDIAKEGKNPINHALASYATNTQPTQNAQATQNTPPAQNANLIISQNFLRSSPILTAVLRTADPELVAKAYQRAEQELVLNLLDKWVQDEQARLEAARKDDQKRTVLSPTYELMRQYVQDVRSGQMPLAQPIISLFVVGMLAAPGIASIGSIGFSEAVIAMLPQAVRTELLLIAAGIMPTAMYWSMPVVISLLGNKIVGAEGKVIDEMTIRAYTLALMTLVNSPEMMRLLQSIVTARSPETPPEKMRQYIAILKITLMANVLIALERLQLGHFTGIEFLALFQGEIPYPESDIRHGILKLLREEAELLTPEQKETLLNSLAEFVDSNPSIETLINPAKTFISICNPRYFNEKATSQSV